MCSRRSHVWYIALVLLVGIMLVGCVPPGKRELTFIPPLLGASQFPQMRGPAQQLAAYLTQQSGIKVGVFVPTDYGNTLLGLKDWKYDIAYLPAGLYPRAEAELGVTPAFLVVVNGSPTEDSAIWVKADSGINSLVDLRGKTIAAAEPSSAAGWVLPAAELKRAGVDPISDVSVNFRAVDADSLVDLLTGKADAAFAPYSALENKAVVDAGGASQLKALKEFKGVPIGVIVYNKTVLPYQATKLRGALGASAGAMGKDAKGNAIPLLQVFGWSGLVAAQPSDFDVIRASAKELGMIQ